MRPCTTESIRNRSLQGLATQHRVENPAVQEQVIIQEIPQVPIVEQIPEQIVDITDLVHPQFSITGVEVSAPQAVGSFPPFEESLMRLRTTKFIWNRSLLERRHRTHLKPSCARTGDRSGNSSGSTLMSA